MTMTLEQVRHRLDEWGCSSLGQVQLPTAYLRQWRDALDAHLSQPAQGRGEAVVGAKGKFISESGYCFSGTLDSVLYKVWLNDGSLVTIGRDEFILDANPTRSSPAVAPDDERLHSGSAEDVAQWLYANGHHDAAFTVRQQLDVRNERIRALESTHLSQPAQAVDVETYKSLLTDAQEHHLACIKDAYRLLGIDDSDGEYRYKWVALEIANLTRALSTAQAEPVALLRISKGSAEGITAYKFIRLEKLCTLPFGEYKLALAAPAPGKEG